MKINHKNEEKITPRFFFYTLGKGIEVDKYFINIVTHA